MIHHSARAKNNLTDEWEGNKSSIKKRTIIELLVTWKSSKLSTLLAH